MADGTFTAHITPAELADYLAGRLLESRQEAIEMHLGGCDACAEEARQFRAFSAVWEDWIMQPPEATWEQVALVTALQQAQRRVADPAWQERLARWQTHWQGQAAAAARLVLDAVDQAARVVLERLDTLATPENRWGFALASGSALDRGPGEDQDVAPGVVESAPEAPQVTIRVGQVSPEATRRIQVRVRGLPARQPPPLVLLIPATAGGVPQVAALVPWQGSAWLVAQFRNVPQDNYLLAFEPTGNTSPA
jgi:anti-sigma factor RsiW